MDVSRLQKRLDVSKGLDQLGVAPTDHERDKAESLLDHLEEIADQANTLKKEIRRSQMTAPPSPIETTDKSPRNSERLLFALLAALGEMGELSAAARQTPPNSVSNQQSIETELADVVAYLAKLADAAQTDVLRSFLIGAIINHWRFKSRPKTRRLYVSICGLSGSGKSTLVRETAAKFANSECYTEHVYNNKYFPPRNKTDVARSQDWFLSAQEAALRETGANICVYEQAPIAVSLGYSYALHQAGKMTDTRFHAHLEKALRVEEWVSKNFSTRLFIYLRCDERIRRDRLRKRDAPAPDFLSDSAIEDAIKARFELLEKGFGGRFTVAHIDTSKSSIEESSEEIAGMISKAVSN